MTRTDLDMPATRDFGWVLKPSENTCFDIRRRPRGQFSVAPHHALLASRRAERARWWFRTFKKRIVRLTDTPGFESQIAPADGVWPTQDHLSAELSGPSAADENPPAGTKMRFREAMRYETCGWTKPVDTKRQVATWAEARDADTRVLITPEEKEALRNAHAGLVLETV